MRALSDVAMDLVEIYLLFELIKAYLFVGIFSCSLFEELTTCFLSTIVYCTLFFLVLGKLLAVCSFY
jgi:hypothetical protein